MSFPVVSGAGPVVGVSTNATETWAVTANGFFFRATTGAFTQVPGFSSLITTGIYVAPDGMVFTAHSGNIRRCASGCTSAASHTLTPYPGNDFVAVCGASSSDVYFVGQDFSANAFLVHFDGGTLTTVSANLGLTSPRACSLTASGALYVAGRRDVVRWEGGTAWLEQANLTALGTSADTHQWYGVGGAGDEVFAVGGRAHIIRRTGPGQWTLVQTLFSTGALRAVAGLSAGEAYAAGYLGGSPSLYRWDGGVWAESTNQPPSALVNTASIAVRSAHEVFLGGSDSNQDGVVVRGTR